MVAKMTYSNNNQTLTLPTVRLVLGILAIVLSLVFAIQFVSQGATGAAVISAIIFCIITEFAKVAFCGDFGYYFETGQGSKALFSGVIVAILFALSISSAVFVLTISPAKNETLVTQSDSKVNALQSQIAAKQSLLNACNPQYVSKCIKPLNDQVNALQSNLNALLKDSDSLIEAKANAQFWAKAAGYLGTDANSLQIDFAIARAVILDLLGLVLISQYTATKRINSDLMRYQQQPPQVQQQPIEQPPQVQQPPQEKQAQQLPPINYKVSNFAKW
jgi:hypothetical protein